MALKGRSRRDGMNTAWWYCPWVQITPNNRKWWILPMPLTTLFCLPTCPQHSNTVCNDNAETVMLYEKSGLKNRGQALRNRPWMWYLVSLLRTRKQSKYIATDGSRAQRVHSLRASCRNGDSSCLSLQETVIYSNEIQYLQICEVPTQAVYMQ